MLIRGNKQHFQTKMTKCKLLDGQNNLDTAEVGFLLMHNVFHFPLNYKGM